MAETPQESRVELAARLEVWAHRLDGLSATSDTTSIARTLREAASALRASTEGAGEARVEAGWTISLGERPCTGPHKWATVQTLPPGLREGWQTACLKPGCTVHALSYQATKPPAPDSPTEQGGTARPHPFEKLPGPKVKLAARVKPGEKGICPIHGEQVADEWGECSWRQEKHGCGYFLDPAPVDPTQLAPSASGASEGDESCEGSDPSRVGCPLCDSGTDYEISGEDAFDDLRRTIDGPDGMLNELIDLRARLDNIGEVRSVTVLDVMANLLPEGATHGDLLARLRPDEPAQEDQGSEQERVARVLREILDGHYLRRWDHDHSCLMNAYYDEGVGPGVERTCSCGHDLYVRAQHALEAASSTEPEQPTRADRGEQ